MKTNKAGMGILKMGRRADLMVAPMKNKMKPTNTPGLGIMKMGRQADLMDWLISQESR